METNYRCILILLVITMACSNKSQEQSHPLQAKAKDLVGTWEIVYPDMVVTTTFTQDNKFEQSMNGQVYLKGTYTNDETRNPHELNLTYTYCVKEDTSECPMMNEEFACYVYRIIEDTLILAHDCDSDHGSRPEGFTNEYDVEKAIRLIN